jgi:hypothetical protein
MIRPTPPADIADHTVTADDDTGAWSCVCGAGNAAGAPNLGGADASTRARAHQYAQGRRLLPTLPAEQLAQILRGSAVNDTRARAAIDLLVHHGYWMRNGNFRDYLDAEWEHGTLTVSVDWRAVKLGLDQPGRIIGALTATDDIDVRLSPELRARMVRLSMDLQQWRRDRDEERWDEASAYDGCPLLKASTSEVAYLRWACSLASDGLVALSDDTANLGNAGRGLFLTALGHLLSHGGNVAFRSALTWPEYLRRPAEQPSPQEVVRELFPTDGPHSAELTGQGGSVLADMVRWLNYATSPQGGITYPSTASDVIGSVGRAVGLFDQTLTQTEQRLTELAQAPHATVAMPLNDPRWPDRGTAPGTARAVAVRLQEARRLLQAAAAELRDAHVYAGRLGLDLPNDESTDAD